MISDSATANAIVTGVAFIVVLVCGILLARWAYKGMDRYNDRLRERGDKKVHPIGPMRYRRLWVVDDDSGADDPSEERRQEDHR